MSSDRFPFDLEPYKKLRYIDIYLYSRKILRVIMRTAVIQSFRFEKLVYFIYRSIYTCFWCDWRSTQVVTDIFSFLFSWDNRWNSIFSSLNFQQILVNIFSNDRQCSSYYISLKRKKYDSYGTSEISSTMEFWVSDYRKNISLKWINFAICETRFPFFNDFQILYAGSNTIIKILYETSLHEC